MHCCPSEIEAGNSLDAKSVPLIDLADNVELIAAKGGQMIYQALMCDRPPTDNIDLRLGLKYLQDREKVVKGVYKGYAQVGNDHPIAPSDPMYCADIPVRPYDPDKAKFHLKKAGMEDGERRDLHVLHRRTGQRGAVAVVPADRGRRVV